MYGACEVNPSSWAAKKVSTPMFQDLGAITTSGDTVALAASQQEDMKLFDPGTGDYVYATLTRDPSSVFGIYLYKCLRANLPLGPWALVSETPLAVTGSQIGINDDWVAAGHIIKMPDTSWRLYHFGKGDETGSCCMLLSTAPAGTAIEDLPTALVFYGMVLQYNQYLNDALIFTPTASGQSGWVAFICDGSVDGETYYGVRATSPDGLVWTVPTGDHILDKGAAGEWDSKCVIPIGQPFRLDGAWTITYQAASSNRWQVGLATVNDALTTIAKSPNNPVLAIGGTGMQGSRENPGSLWVGSDLYLYSVDASQFGAALIDGGQGYYKVHVSKLL